MIRENRFPILIVLLLTMSLTPAAIADDLSNLYVGKYVTYNFNHLLQFPNETSFFQTGTIEYRINSYNSTTNEYTLTTTSDLSSSTGESSSDTKSRTTHSSNPFEVEDIIHLIDITFPGSSDIKITPTGSGTVKIGNESYQTTDYEYLIIKKQELERKSLPDGTSIEPVLITKIT